MWGTAWVISQPEARSLLIDNRHRWILLALAAFATIVPQLWIWLESDAFFTWHSAKFVPPGCVDTGTPACRYDSAAAKFSRDKFKMHVDNAKAVWTAVIGLFAAIFLKK